MIEKIADGWLDAFLIDYRTRIAELAMIAGGEAADVMLGQMEGMWPDLLGDIQAMRHRRHELDALIGTTDKAAAFAFVDNLDGETPEERGEAADVCHAIMNELRRRETERKTATAEVGRLRAELAALRPLIGDAQGVIARGVELMPLDKLSQWEGVRGWQEAAHAATSR